MTTTRGVAGCHSEVAVRMTSHRISPAPRRRPAGRWGLHRISWISSVEEAELEERRQALRDRRWERHKDMLHTLTVMLVALAGVASVAAIGPASLWARLAHLVTALVGTF
jgi:hypothetical protein